jgi:pimeloyl-ACP methyl ester carboxylesterase
MPHADVNGLSISYEEHGSGAPLVLLHGGIGAGDQFAPILPALTAERRVITVDLQGHGRTPDADRALQPELLADDVAALIAHLGLEEADVAGYSLGGLVALRVAIQHPEAVRRLVLISVAFRRDGSHPEVVAAMDAFGPEMADMMVGSPPHQLYTQIAPRPEDWPTLVAKTSDMLKRDYDWSAEVADLQPQTLLVFADADSIRPAHVAEFFGLLGGGLRDAVWDGSQQPRNRLAVLAGHTHYDVSTSPALAPTVLRFLDEPVR